MHIDEKWSKDDDLDYRLSTKIQFVIEKWKKSKWSYNFATKKVILLAFNFSILLSVCVTDDND